MTGLRPYIPPAQMPVGTRLIFHESHIPSGWVVYEPVVLGSGQWFLCEKMMMTEKKEQDD